MRSTVFAATPAGSSNSSPAIGVVTSHSTNVVEFDLDVFAAPSSCGVGFCLDKSAGLSVSTFRFWFLSASLLNFSLLFVACCCRSPNVATVPTVSCTPWILGRSNKTIVDDGTLAINKITPMKGKIEVPNTKRRFKALVLQTRFVLFVVARVDLGNFSGS